MSYERFAYLYDELMQDAPYHQWAELVLKKLEDYGVKGRTLLDLACGTGELSLRFAREGFQVTGVDLSTDMLSVARSKAEDAGFHLPFFEQNMAELEGLGQFDVIGVFCDSLNYLQTAEEVEKTFSKVYQHLKEDGLFIFDVHSIYKITQVFMNQTFTLNEDRLAYIWNSFPGEAPNSVEHELSFFVLDESSSKYNRFDEIHFQRTFSVEQYSRWLEHAGFKLLEVCADFEDASPSADSERIFFIAKRID
ncbi:class I SAM-dependent methyltransferase [Neobacillus sp. PS3-34]|uniref:class I SAM-dependent DNA methyltransferase n=1 Tax=Neobacillus sp. PS3-34 TaxID=3070678 RepID=UPI0027DFDE72|nr:class I SAM-dependent methyltransferase [Neobacillus sp. PS3-34]WML47455.1 class I SAM-dependent methyltransferase [Neobacillus sp. PS3-34]